MKKEIQEAVENYQCPGCTQGPFPDCFQQDIQGLGCGNHVAGTHMSMVGTILLGMPKPFMRLGEATSTKPKIFESYEQHDGFDKWNIPVWKYKDENGNTLIRGIMPRRNEPFIHIILEDCVDKVNCYEITEEDIKFMD